MGWLYAPDYWLARWLFERLLAAIYVVAFLNAANQFPALLGEHGLLPAPRLLAVARFRELPSLFHLGYSDRLLRGVAFAGVLLAASLLLGLPQAGPVWLPMLVWLALWAGYLSIVNIGQTFYSFGWESLLVETGFLAVFLGNASMPPPTPILWLMRWLLFRLEFGAGLIKIRHDPCWRDLTCLYYHHETQPMPNPLSWYFHHLPKWMHRMEVRGNHIGQLVVPFGLFLPQPIAGIAALIMIVHQVWLILSGNFAWLNWLTLALAVVAFDNQQLGLLFPLHVVGLDNQQLGLLRPLQASSLAAPPLAFSVVLVVATLVLVVLSYWPARNLVSRSQAMNSAYNPLHLVNSYGAFGSITRERNELAVEGTLDREITPETVWREYAFKGKPGDVRRNPVQVAPYHLRLDWLMWFAAISPAYAEAWLMPLVVKLLEHDRATLRLLAADPFGVLGPPRYVRVTLYRYRFSSVQERHATGDVWVRRRIATFLQPVRLQGTAPQEGEVSRSNESSPSGR